MAQLANQISKQLSEGGVDVQLASCYVDDVRQVLAKLAKGSRWDRRMKRIVHNNNLVEKHDCKSDN